MPYEPFPQFFPVKAKTETRGVTVPKINPLGLLGGQYIFFEYYCTDLDCDCHNVLINIVNIETDQVQATISYGWKSLKFYKEWMGGDPPNDMLKEFKGPALKQMNVQSEFAPRWLKIFKDMIQGDKDYADRLKRHYQLVKNKIEKKRK